MNIRRLMKKNVKRVTALGLGLLVAGQRTANFTVNTIRLVFSSKTRSAILTLRNQSPEALCFQLNGFAWDQSTKGEMQLAPTEDIIFFPKLLTLAPDESRNIRVGPTTPFTAIEKAYRVFVEELPPLERLEDGPTGVLVLTKMGIPIFLQPTKVVQQGHIGSMTVRQGKLSFQVKNTGNVHLMEQQVRGKALSQAGDNLLDQQKAGWYVLVGSLRTHELELPKDACAKIRTLAIEVQTEGKTFQERFAVPLGSCGSWRPVRRDLSHDLITADIPDALQPADHRSRMDHPGSVAGQKLGAQAQHAIFGLTVKLIDKGEVLVVLRDEDVLARLPDLLPPTVLNLRTYRPPGLIYAQNSSALVNYSLNWSDFERFDAFSEAGVSLGGNLLAASFTRTGEGEFIRGYTSLIMDERDSLRCWVIDDHFIGTGLLGGGAFLGGISMSRDFSLAPYLFRYPSLGFAGALLTPSTVDIYVNCILLRREPCHRARSSCATCRLTPAAASRKWSSVTPKGKEVVSPIGKSGEFYLENLTAGRHPAKIEFKQACVRSCWRFRKVKRHSSTWGRCAASPSEQG
jgi:fimbrial chaperone protein